MGKAGEDMRCHERVVRKQTHYLKKKITANKWRKEEEEGEKGRWERRVGNREKEQPSWSSTAASKGAHLQGQPGPWGLCLGPHVSCLSLETSQRWRVGFAQVISGLGSALGRPVVSSVAPSRVSWRPSFLKDAPSQFSLPVIELLLFSSSVVSLCDPWTVVHRLLCPRDFPGKHTGAGCHFLLQGIFCIGAVGKESEGDLLDPEIEIAQCRRHKRCGVYPWDGKTSVEGHGSSP